MSNGSNTRKMKGNLPQKWSYRQKLVAPLKDVLWLEMIAYHYFLGYGEQA